MSALDVLAARRGVIVANIAKKDRYIENASADRDKMQAALDSVDKGIEALEAAGFVREWEDEELGRMSFFSKFS